MFGSILRLINVNEKVESFDHEHWEGIVETLITAMTRVVDGGEHERPGDTEDIQPI